jgi:hypothetical protein
MGRACAQLKPPMDSIWGALLNMAARDWLVVLFGFLGGAIGTLHADQMRLHFGLNKRKHPRRRS